MRLSDDSRLSDRRVTEWFLLERARKEERKAEKQPVGVQPVITISRQYGAGGHSVADKLVTWMGPKWQVWDKEIIEAIAQSAQERTEMVASLDEVTQSWMEQMVRSLFNVRYMEAQAYHRHLAQVLLALAQQGRKVIIGRGANFVLPEALNVRLEAGLDFRVNDIMERYKVTKDEALRKIHEVDRVRADFTKRVFNRDITDRRAYDIIIQTDAIGFDATAAAIAAAANTMFSTIREGAKPVHA